MVPTSVTVTVDRLVVFKDDDSLDRDLAIAGDTLRNLYLESRTFEIIADRENHIELDLPEATRNTCRIDARVWTLSKANPKLSYEDLRARAEQELGLADATPAP